MNVTRKHPIRTGKKQTARQVPPLEHDEWMNKEDPKSN